MVLLAWCFTPYIRSQRLKSHCIKIKLASLEAFPRTFCYISYFMDIAFWGMLNIEEITPRHSTRVICIQDAMDKRVQFLSRVNMTGRLQTLSLFCVSFIMRRMAYSKLFYYLCVLELVINNIIQNEKPDVVILQ